MISRLLGRMSAPARMASAIMAGGAAGRIFAAPPPPRAPNPLPISPAPPQPAGAEAAPPAAAEAEHHLPYSQRDARIGGAERDPGDHHADEGERMRRHPPAPHPLQAARDREVLPGVVDQQEEAVQASPDDIGPGSAMPQ